MIYLTKERALFANDGKFIKSIDCPLASKLGRDISAANPERAFNCPECASKVMNLRFLTDDQAIAEVEADSNVCFFATPAASNVVHLSLPYDSEWRSANEYRVGLNEATGGKIPTINTARTIEEMNFAVENGFLVVPRKVDCQAGAKDSLSLYRNESTGLFSCIFDMRHSPYHAEASGLTRVFDFFTYSTDEAVSPVAGYVIPKDLAAGSRVFIEDVIEHLVQDYPQNSAVRMPSWWGTWTGEDVVLARFEQEVIFG